MAETIIKTLTCLLIAAAIGFAVAWLLRGLNLAELRERINALVRDLIERDGRIHALQVESGGLRVQLGTETGKLRGAMSELGSLAAALTSTRAERDDERRSVAHWQDQHQSIKTRTSEMEMEILNLRDELNSAHAAVQHGQTDAAAAHARSLAERDEQVASLTAALAAARTTTTTPDIEPLNNKLRSLTTDVTTARQALAARESELIALRTNAAKSQSQMADLEARLKALSDSHAKVTDGHAQTLVERDATIAVISTALEKSRLPLAASTESSGHAQALASDLTAAQQALAARDAELVAQRHAAEALRTRLLTLEGQLSAGQSGDLGPLADADELREHLAILQEDAAHRTTELARVRAELTRLAALPAALKAAQEKANAHALMATDWQNRFAHLETEMATSTQRLTAAAAAKEATSAQGLAAAQAEATRLGTELRSQVDKLQLDLRQAREDSKARAAELARASTALAEMEAALKARGSALDASTQAAREFEADLVALRTRHAELENRWQRAAKAEIELRRLGDRYQTLAARFQSAERERSEWALRFAEIERAEAARQTEPMPLFGDEQAPDDDLTQLPGVTAALAAMLNGLDVQRFQQVALWDDQDVEFYDRRLKGHQGQIRRDRWVRSAAELHHRKYGEWLIDIPT